jgi:hypothetical protein
VCTNDAFRQRLVAAGGARLHDFDLARTRRRFLDVLVARGVGGDQ